MRIFTCLLLSLLFTASYAASISGQLKNNEGDPVGFANVALYSAADSSLYKVEASDDQGLFKLRNIEAGNYFLIASYIGLNDLVKTDISLTADQELNLEVLSFGVAAVDLAEATVKASRAIIEVKPDRTVFNVEGTINSVGTDALSLLRKAPAVTVDNNDNISVLGRTGVLVYLDGKRLPLSGDDLSSYLQNIPAEQIDRIDIITNPSARYEAEGNAGIIDIRLKRDKNHGTNGAVNASYSKGRHYQYNTGLSANFRNKRLNAFGNIGVSERKGFNDIYFNSTQNGVFLDESNETIRFDENINYRFGTDFFLGGNHTIGFILGGNLNDNSNDNTNRIGIGLDTDVILIDSILVAENEENGDRMQQQYNINYRYDDRKAGRNLNIDLDFGRFERESQRYQPNLYFDGKEENILSTVINEFDTPTDIDIYTFKVDYEQAMMGGQLGVGTKLSRVVSDNTFLFYDVFDNTAIQNNRKSNIFDYNENVYAGYLTFARPINEKLNFSAGLRLEQTDADGELQVFADSLSEPPFELNYLSWFPSAGLTWQLKPMHTLALNYGRRINRPDYNVLNPFENQLSEISFWKGNPFLSPEIVNNIELSYTLNYRYNFKLGYSKTDDPITRLIGPDSVDVNANYIQWDNLDAQTIFSGNISAPVQIKKWWSAFFNLSASYLDNQADYGDGAVVNLQKFTYSIYQQHTFDLPGGFKGEISGYFSGPGVWGGVFEYDESWGLDLGLQKRFFQDRLNVKISASDIFYETGWSGFSDFNGLYSAGNGSWDSRRVTLSASYRFGNENVKSRKRRTGIEDEAGRVGGGN